MRTKKTLTLKRHVAGFSLLEVVIGTAIFLLVSTSLYATYQRVFSIAHLAQARIEAVALANEQFEIARNLPYNEVGTVGGVPSGVLLPVQTLTRGGLTFIATTTVRNIDQPFDGLIGGIPNDLSPGDNKMIEIDLVCISCTSFRPLVLSTIVAPKHLENASTNGSLFISAIDAGGQPVVGADVHVYNGMGTTTIDINDVTATSGMLQIIDAPPGNQAYQITVSKGGYSTESTYRPGVLPTSNPVKPDATVAVQTVTQLTFGIDRLATLHFSSVDTACTPVGNVQMHMSGTKLLSITPDVLKHDMWMSTNAFGELTQDDVEWDTYAILATSSSHDLAGVVPLQPFAVNPGGVQEVQLVMTPKDSPSVVVTVKDSGTGLPIAGASVTLEKGGVPIEQTTGRGYLRQTDWSGGPGQSVFVDPSQYESHDSGIDTFTTPGQVSLLETLGVYPADGALYSSTFDTGSPSNFYQLTSAPTSQPPQTGDSVRFQLATGNATSTWNYIGPDGTAFTYYNSTTTDIATVHDGDRYLRYKMLLSTASTSFSPSVSDVQFTFTSDCIPPGQVIFQGLASGTYDVTVSKSGYTTAFDTVVVSAGVSWQEKVVPIGP